MVGLSPIATANAKSSGIQSPKRRHRSLAYGLDHSCCPGTGEHKSVPRLRLSTHRKRLEIPRLPRSRATSVPRASASTTCPVGDGMTPPRSMKVMANAGSVLNRKLLRRYGDGRRCSSYAPQSNAAASAYPSCAFIALIRTVRAFDASLSP